MVAIPNVDMWVCATGARHSKSLERRSQRTATVFTGEAKIYTDVYISRESGEWWISNVDIWVGTRSVWHSKSLERRCKQQYVCFRAAIIQGVH